MDKYQKSAILKKIGRPEGFNLPYHPKDIRPYLLTLNNALDRIDFEDGTHLVNCVYSLYALDRNPQPYSENWVSENNMYLRLFMAILKRNALPQTCEKCGGEDSLKFDKHRICQDCINKM